MHTYAIIGAGATGQLLFLLLTEVGKVSPGQIVLIDPHFDGGDLRRRWGSVQSNTPWAKTAGAIRTAMPSLTFSDPEDPQATTPLADLAALVTKLAGPALRQATRVCAHATVAREEPFGWSIETTAGGPPIQTKAIFLCQGSEPRGLNLPIPSIPLEIALDEQRLATYVSKGQHVLVFGTMHSGTLVLRNLGLAGATVTALYNTDSPFVWDRNGAYDGLKAEAATIADEITRGAMPYEKALTLAHITNTEAIVRASARADWVVYAMGFKPRAGIQILNRAGEPRPIPFEYDGATGAIAGVQAAWGFGVAYPNRAPDGVHWDVSLAAFIEHMAKQLPAILALS